MNDLYLFIFVFRLWQSRWSSALRTHTWQVLPSVRTACVHLLVFLVLSISWSETFATYSNTQTVLGVVYVNFWSEMYLYIYIKKKVTMILEILNTWGRLGLSEFKAWNEIVGTDACGKKYTLSSTPAGAEHWLTVKSCETQWLRMNHWALRMKQTQTHTHTRLALNLPSTEDKRSIYSFFSVVCHSVSR